MTPLCEFVKGNIVGPHRTLRWGSSTLPLNEIGKTFWSIETPLRKEKFLLLMKMKFLENDLCPILTQCLLDEPSSLRDELFVSSAIAARKNNVPLDKLWPRIEFIADLLNKPQFKKIILKQWENRFPYRVREYDVPTRKPKKFSGYVRNSSSVGSKRRLPRMEPDPETLQWDSGEKLDVLTFLTVGELKGHSVSLRHPDEGPISPKRLRSEPK